MTLADEYLEYPRRRTGMDHGLYPYSNLFKRAPVSWPEGKAVAVPIVVSLEWFPITPSAKPFLAPGHMQTAYPDFRHYTAREYGTRVGVFRLLKAFAKAGVQAGFAVNAEIARRYPSTVDAIIGGGHEIIAHSTDMNGTIATGLPEEEERALIEHSLAILTDASGVKPKGWLSIAQSQSWNTPRLLAAAGLSFMLDWVNDDLPYTMTTEAGNIINLPLNHELSDRQIITKQQQSVDSYCMQIRDALAWLGAEANSYGGRMLPLHLTPYIMALPYRIDAFEHLLAELTTSPSAWVTTPGKVVDATSEYLETTGS